jgi:hypothetical protein
LHNSRRGWSRGVAVLLPGISMGGDPTPKEVICAVEVVFVVVTLLEIKAS